MAAPSFTQVWGPKAGCDDIGMKSVQTFMLSTLNESQVTDTCKSTCLETPDCMFLYVQLTYPANNFWNCYYNNHTFNEKKDLNCSKDTSIWGIAKGHSVVGRQPEIAVQFPFNNTFLCLQTLDSDALSMDDLLNTDWTAAAPAAKQNAPRPAFGMPMSIPSAASSSRASPAPSPFANNLPAAKAPSKTASPANDIFANLVSTNANKNQGNLSLLERQKQLQQDKIKQEQQQRQKYAQQYGNEANFWDNLGSGKATPQSTTIRHVAPPAEHDEDDLLAAFNSAAPVDKSSHFPVPAASTAASGRNTPAVANQSNSASLLADDDDDPFGLGAVPQRKPSPYQPPQATTNDDDDDILGDLGKPVTAKPPRREPPRREPVDEAFAVNDRRSPPSSDPLDRPIAELVDMGFPADKSRAALQETGGDVQSAV
ncbi:hypothetical protein KCU89_g6708, partial [Aureobasidium melanogenum]